MRRFLAYYRPWAGLFWLDFGCAVFAGLLELAFPLAVQSFIDRLLPSGNWGIIALATAALALIYLLNTALMAVVTYWGHMLGINIETEMRARAFAHLQRLSFSFYDKQRTGRLVARVTRDLEEIGEIAHHGPEDLFIAVMTFAGAFALMLWINVPLALVSAVIVPAMTAVTVIYGSRMTRTWQTILGRVADFNVRLEENVGGMRVVQAFANERHEQTLFARDNANYRQAKLDAYRVMAGSVSLTYMGMRAVQVIVMVVGAWLVLQGGLTEGGFVAFLLLVGVLLRPVEKIAAVIELYPRGLAGFRRYCDLLDTVPEIADRPGARPAPAFRGEVEFENLRFGYDEARPVLDGITARIGAGKTAAFIGQSGAGKSTLLSLVPRFYEAAGGAIRIDGHDIRDLTLDSLRAQIGIVQQDVFLFGGTLGDNIAYGRIGATRDEIVAVAEQASLGPLIAALPDGLDTIVGERGVTLSGGQKQRVAIARAFLKNPPILILDEATSALDTETERAIQTALDALSKDRTTLVIAHRLDTIRDADMVFRLEGGGLERLNGAPVEPARVWA
ncbi:ABC transporter ATP-binding protein [Mesobaculum littorinae]|uniref:ABC transporter ATP-binding protein n=1 Tax=Mesobaculum littorinae TaxID=2486419 RepID=A0A438AL86_9RHOB|nr:ABC transporter ATP-binding protein [Mesobaculum littorinae]RVV99432.1 ABC transporter ATP-binding protein [Mesobaculum littorinae]